jgi:hypothetical protein
MRGIGIDLEVDIYATKLAKEKSRWTPMYGIKGELVKTVPTASAICGVFLLIIQNPNDGQSPKTQ